MSYDAALVRPTLDYILLPTFIQFLQNLTLKGKLKQMSRYTRLGTF